jgi:uncharacterized protein DUF2865
MSMWVSSNFWRRNSSFASAAVAYALGISFGAGVTGYGVCVGHALAGDLKYPPKAQVVVKADGPKAPALAKASSGKSTVVREAIMTPTQDRWSRSTWRRDRDDDADEGQPFGSSSRSAYRGRGFFDGLFGDSDWERPRDTYRTVCVRLCDGYYFPVSFSATPDRFERDRQSCENSCGTQGRLFVYRNPGGEPDDMQDLQGRPYRQLRTAFLYRTEYVADCKCKPHPWEQQATDQHRLYALAAAKRKGDKDAAAQVTALESRMRDPTPQARPTKSARWSLGSEASDAARSKQAGLADASNDPELMRLGQARKEARGQDTKQRPNREADWARDLWRQRTQVGR